MYTGGVHVIKFLFVSLLLMSFYYGVRGELGQEPRKVEENYVSSHNKIY